MSAGNIKTAEKTIRLIVQDNIKDINDIVQIRRYIIDNSDEFLKQLYSSERFLKRKTLSSKNLFFSEIKTCIKKIFLISDKEILSKIKFVSNELNI